jgi:hypothetical protein
LKNYLIEARGIEEVISVHRTRIVEEQDLISRARFEALFRVAEVEGADLEMSDRIENVKPVLRRSPFDGRRDLHAQERCRNSAVEANINRTDDAPQD